MITSLQNIPEIQSSMKGYKPTSNPFNRFTHLANERENTGSHLTMTTPGVIVSTGTHRSLANLVHCATKYPGMCQGLVVIDVNPNACAWIHLTALFLKHSEGLENFREMTLQTNPEQQKQIVETILEKEKASGGVLQDFYARHVQNFAKYYFNPKAYDKEASFDHQTAWLTHSAADFPINPFTNKEHYTILKSYAQNGNIVAVAQDIGNLEFLQKAERPISLIDVSNILDYKLLVISPLPYSCTICWTKLAQDRKTSETFTQYFSEEYKPLTDETQRSNLHQLIDASQMHSINDTTSPSENAPLSRTNFPLQSDRPTRLLCNAETALKLLTLFYRNPLKEAEPPKAEKKIALEGPGKERLCALQ